MSRAFRSLVPPYFSLLVLTIVLGAPSSAQVSHELLLQLDPGQSGADIKLEGNLHTVEGSFLMKRGSIHFDPANGRVSGEIVFDATSGKTGNGSRDNKMHKDVLESWRYTEIVFRPDHADGALTPSGTSKLQVHGIFLIHGAEHEVTFPVEVTLSGNAWSAKSSFQVPYARWGMKNPSVLLLKVGDVVQVEFHAAGSVAP
ncbi:MAG TPA: YceI family protein [Terriglobales bacterium]|jgi:polyisoprenoid-binding protein YceI|nr:YceI family protein [Terriglobales bacterium]